MKIMRAKVGAKNRVTRKKGGKARRKRSSKGVVHKGCNKC